MGNAKIKYRAYPLATAVQNIYIVLLIPTL
jgi:hypothetical protein